eukprot:TRINITY_DN6205_c0_g1_i1.p1 TRINITY_DN6205_c0_g1~~TRINITY_DN6205_c0_g1_i1.p1  ORF type:complete len:157 (+),score=27.07 TRINITY_DN6205_c0_g1_i1:22-492(+)
MLYIAKDTEKLLVIKQTRWKIWISSFLIAAFAFSPYFVIDTEGYIWYQVGQVIFTIVWIGVAFFSINKNEVCTFDFERNLYIKEVVGWGLPNRYMHHIDHIQPKDICVVENHRKKKTFQIMIECNDGISVPLMTLFFRDRAHLEDIVKVIQGKIKA